MYDIDDIIAVLKAFSQKEGDPGRFDAMLDFVSELTNLSADAIVDKLHESEKNI